MLDTDRGVLFRVEESEYGADDSEDRIVEEGVELGPESRLNADEEVSEGSPPRYDCEE